MLTVTEENYLKAIFNLSGNQSLNVSTSALSKAMDTSAASVTDMIQRLSEKRLVHYEKYKGASLTIEGANIATSLIRKHRLWEVFLVNKLKFSWEEVHEIAEQLEHIKSETLTKKLDAFLDFPTVDPHGDPIPDAEGNINYIPQRPLAQLQLNEQGQVSGVKDTNIKFLKYLNSVKVQLGTKVKVIDKIEYDKSLTLLVDGERTITFSDMAAQNLFVH